MVVSFEYVHGIFRISIHPPCTKNKSSPYPTLPSRIYDHSGYLGRLVRAVTADFFASNKAKNRGDTPSLSIIPLRSYLSPPRPASERSGKAQLRQDSSVFCSVISSGYLGRLARAVTADFSFPVRQERRRNAPHLEKFCFAAIFLRPVGLLSVAAKRNCEEIFCAGKADIRRNTLCISRMAAAVRAEKIPQGPLTPSLDAQLNPKRQKGAVSRMVKQPL